jgi:drug/metabolite transporter (DMT)-like permease
MFGVVVAHYLTDDEHITLSRVIGVIVGLFGVTVMIGFSAFSALGLELVAPLAIVSGALSYSFASVFGRRFRAQGVAPITTATGQVLASSVILIPMVLMVDQPWAMSTPGIDSAGAVLGLGVLSTGLAFIVYFRLLSTAGANNVLLVTFLLPITAILLGVAVLDEVLRTQHIQGIVLVGLGLIVIDGRVSRAVRTILTR